MTSDAIEVVRCVFSTIWQLTTCFQIPGTQTTPAEWALFSLLFVYVIRTIKRIIFEDDARDPLGGD